VSVRLTLICHAATTAVHGAAFPLDEPIDAPRRAQIRAPAYDLAPGAEVFTSPALRARQTAAALGLSATVAPVLRDIDLGRWAGRSFDDVQAAEPEAMAAWTGAPDAAPHGGESVADLFRRVGPWLDGMRAGRRRIVAVTHPAVIRAAIVLAIDSGAGAFWRIDVGPLCVAELRSNGSRWTLRSLGALRAPGALPAADVDPP
jgi:broad specificity phosphatase PhoE